MNLADFLEKQVGVFKNFSRDRLLQLLDGSRVVSFEAREAIAHAGEEAAHFGVVLNGVVSASVLEARGGRQQLGHLKAGETFGEAALMTGNPLLADLIAETRCEVLLIPVSLFQSVIVAEPAGVKHISRAIAGRMRTWPIRRRRRQHCARGTIRTASNSRASGGRRFSSSTAAPRR
jgi:acetate kinase